jgi:hypothetical protein
MGGFHFTPITKAIETVYLWHNEYRDLLNPDFL